MKEIKFTISIEPLPQPRPRFSRGYCYQPKAIIEYKEEIKKAACSAMKDAQPLTGELTANIKLYRKYKTCSRRFGDLDNHAKAILDALNGICFVDDSQVMKLSVEKYTDKDNQHIEVELREV